MTDESEILKQTFKEEAFDLLSELESLLLTLERDPEDMEAVSGIFRAFHTIKGSGAMVGFDDLSQFTHQIETVYDLEHWGLPFSRTAEIYDRAATLTIGPKYTDQDLDDIVAAITKVHKALRA
jgi:chemotaxis protein histidine kinase CheA